MTASAKIKKRRARPSPKARSVKTQKKKIIERSKKEIKELEQLAKNAVLERVTRQKVLENVENLPLAETAALSIRACVYAAFAAAGGVRYLTDIARDDPKTFIPLLAKLLPVEILAEVSGKNGAAIEIQRIERVIVGVAGMMHDQNQITIENEASQS